VRGTLGRHSLESAHGPLTKGARLFLLGHVAFVAVVMVFAAVTCLRVPIRRTDILGGVYWLNVSSLGRRPVLAMGRCYILSVRGNAR